MKNELTIDKPDFFINGLDIYKNLKDRYPSKEWEDLDNIMSSIFTALFMFCQQDLKEDEREQVIKMIMKRLKKHFRCR